MLKVGGWLGGAKHKITHGQTRSLNALDELTQIEDAMSAVTYIMNDDVDAAEAHLSKGSSPFHQLGKGVVTFMRATLGFEQEIIREASEQLSNAETTAYENQRRAHRNPSAYQSPIYPAGTEYAVCLAEAQLMSAIVGVLNESLTEAIKSFYKLRKAYLTLEGVLDAEKKFLKERSTSSLGSTGSAGSSRPASRASARRESPLVSQSLAPEKSTADASRTSMDRAKDKENTKPVPAPAPPLASAEKEKEKTNQDDDDADFDFVDADEEHDNVPTPMEYMGHLNVPVEKGQTVELDISQKELDLNASSARNLPPTDEKPDTSVPDAVEEFEQLTLAETVKANEDVSLFGNHPVDLFIISGSNFCFGILLLMISMVPPAFSTLLKIVGFKGDRERGIQMLWQATKFHNIHGAMAGLVLFMYYQGIVGFCDVIPQTGEGSYPRARCKALLTEMRKRYPESHLWLVEEARMLATEKELEKSVEFAANTKSSKLQQLEALGWFERALHTMYMHDYEATSAAFLKCIALNNWSHGLYYYICGACHVELYRRDKTSHPDSAKVHAAKAVEHFQRVAANTGKKRFMARQLPFDVFVNRKIAKWEERAKEWKCDLIDAIGVSPLEEIIYFWNGYKRMRNCHIDTSLASLAWSESAENPHWAKESLDEKAMLALLRAACLRSKGETDGAKETLLKEIISHDRALFKGHNKDSWTAPCARYEMAANIWREADKDGRPEEHREMLEECKKYLLEVSGWESYDLDAR
ncbi:Mitochondrial outer membrane protein iml2 [Didymosphaeria variabile]|uniref:Inclusion body clearance protein IML2 n=1 Tax=Didymosphaeria variabile TaxID=1932322 RepID=A0A9W8XK56_9PLEO|nr:Mitochondrial outer membrane protein iml2 [Didymosphaeria variabile]KAJ4353352.1 Mitochondrial outer membrane protein iml2 [Didymosphaeria variabile]